MGVRHEPEREPTALRVGCIRHGPHGSAAGDRLGGGGSSAMPHPQPRPLLKGRGWLPKSYITPCLMPLLALQPPATAPPTPSNCPNRPAPAIVTAPGTP